MTCSFKRSGSADRSAAVEQAEASVVPLRLRFANYLPFIALAAASVAILAVYAVTAYGGFFEDDAFISLRYAKRFLQGHGLTWTDGEPVEGYTNFLWVLLIAAAGGLSGAELVNVARVLGIVLTCIGLSAVIAGNAPRRWRAVPPAAAPALALAASGPVATWSIAGLEQPLLAALVTVGAVVAYPLLDSEQQSGPRIWLLSLVWGLAALTRPDGLLFAFAGAVGWVLALNFTKPAFISACKLVALPIVFAVLQACFRQVYYDDWVPNTYYAKVAYTFDRLMLGARYVASNWRALAVFTLPLPIAFYAAVLDRGRRRRIIFVTVPMLAYAAFVVAIGGDTMPQGRHLVVVLFLMALITAEGLQWLVSRDRIGGRTAGAVAAMIVVAAVLAEVQDPGRSRLSVESWVWRGRPLGRFLAKAFGDRDPLLAVDAAGSTPYYAEIDSLDMLGLNDKYLARHRPDDFGRGPFGHELGDGAYILRRKPDLVMFHVPPGRPRPVWRGGIEMVNAPDFARYYQLVRFDTGDPTGKLALLWVRRDESRVGITRVAGQITVPGFLFAGGQAGPVARFDDTERLVTFMPPLTTARVDSFPIGSGTWRANVNSTSQVSLTLKSPGLAEIRGSSGLTFEIPAPFRDLSTYIDVEIRTGRSAANIHAVQFERLR